MNNSTPHPLSTVDILSNFKSSFGFNLKILRDFFNLQTIEVIPDSSSPFYLKNSSGQVRSIHFNADDVIGSESIINKSWDYDKQKFLLEFHESSLDGVVLIDVGANIGLFSRQSLSQNKNIKFVYCYEPEPGNFELLKKNLEDIDNVFLFNKGLFDEAKEVALYKSFVNSGNYSMNKKAMPAHFSETIVDVVDASSQESSWLSHGKPIFYKSNTQGSDEKIATSLSMEFWSNVKVGMLDLWRIDGNDYDKEKFMRILDSFPYKIFRKNPGQNIPSKTVLEYLNSIDGQYDDLLFWR